LYAFYNPVYDSANDSGSIQTLDAWADTGHNESGLLTTAAVKGNIGELKILKDRNPHLKIMISVGGWTKSQDFPAIASSQNARQTFAQSLVNFMTLYPWIDGFDLDWEFPVTGGTGGQEKVRGLVIPVQPHTTNDHKNLVFLLKQMRETFDSNGMQSKEISIAMGNNVVQTVSQFIGPNNEAANNMTENVMDFCEFVTFFGYDFGGNWYDKTCYNAPLFGGDNVNDPLHNPSGRNQVLSELVEVYLTDIGIPADKLIMGIPFYGKLFEGVASTGVDANNPGLYESAPRIVNPACSLPESPVGTWDDLSYTCETSGAIEFCDLSQGVATNPHHFLNPSNPLVASTAAASAGWVRHWDAIAKVPYLYNSTQNKFISYDDSESIDLKVKYALSKNLAGVMIWELSQDARSSTNGLLDALHSSFVNSEFSITLNFNTPSATAIQGVSVEILDASGSLLETQTSDANGQVVFNNKTGFLAYSINYTFSNYSFLPSSVSYSAAEFDSNKVISVIGSDQTSQLQGSVKENGQLLTNTDVVLSDANSNELERFTSADGNFDFSSVINSLNYVLTADKEFYTFTSFTYTNFNSDQINQEIVGTRNSHTISGVVTSTSVGLQGVNLQLTGNNQTYNATTIATNAGTLKSLVERINFEINKKRVDDNLNLEFGWQLNLWAKPNVAGIRGIIRETDNVSGPGSGDFQTQLQKIKQTAIDIFQYGKTMGIMSHGADFISIDKYGLDALGYSNASDPADPSSYTWFWNNDHWLNYFTFVKSLYEESGVHVILWQITVGHINNSTTINEYTGTNFVPLVNTSKHYEDSASPFFFGDEVDFSNDQARFDYFSQNKHQDSKLISNPNNKHVTFGNHFSELNATGVKLVLMGAGVGDSTDGIGDATYPGATLTDDHFWIQKVQDYYINHLITSTLGFESSTISDLSSDFTVLIENQQLVIKNISDSLKNTDVYLFDFTGKLLMDMPNQQIGIRETIRLSQTLLSNTFYVCILKTEGSVGAFKIISK